jgi:hypothetical protein
MARAYCLRDGQVVRPNTFAEAGGVGDTCRVKLDDYLDSFQEVLDHPRHRAAQETLVELIRQLRACTNVNEGYEFQQALLSQILAVERDHYGFRGAIKRMADGKSPQAGAPEPQSGLDPALRSTWQLELDICERVARQFRCVGDALAWRVFGFEREYITTLARNQSPGMMAGKLGLAAELALVEKAWKEDGQFALMHDLTNCLRIGDISVFTDEGPTQIEVKTNAKRRNSVQNRKLRAARRALGRAGPLPGDDRREWLYDLDLPYRTHLDLLRTGTERAAREGIFAAKVRGDRALLVSDLYGCQAQGWTEDQFNDRLARKFSGALRRAGLGPRQASNVQATSLDSVSRDPLRVPFAAYPLHPVACARLIGDIAIFTVETSGPALAASVSDAGIPAKWAWSGSGEIPPGEVVMEMTIKRSWPVPGMLFMEYSKTLQMLRRELDRYLIELAEQKTWIEGVRFTLADPDIPRRPWPCYREEHSVWM